MTVKPHAHFNRVLAAAMKRVDTLEGLLAAVLEPILLEAGTHAAREFEVMATDFLTAGGPRRVRATAGRGLSRVLSASQALTAATPGVTSTSTMVCVKPLPEEAAVLAAEFGEPADSLHVTLVYLGDVDDVTTVIEAVTAVGGNHAALSGTVAGSGVFSAAPDAVASPSILLPDVRGLVELRVAVTDALTRAGIDYSKVHGFEAHITVAYTEEPQEGGYRPDSFGKPLTFNEVLVVRGDVVEARIPLVGPRPLTAAAAKWAAPAGDELLDVDKLVSTLRTKTDPVRLAAIENVMKSSLDHVGIDYDITHPLAGKVLAQSGSQITHIAQSTQLNVMRIIGKAHEQGLTIPDTAKAIRVGMTDAAGSRALLIARTEMVGAVNGASLAATQIAADSLGLTYEKVWMTAPGAPYPRHETYDGLDGQTVALEGYFDVGGAQLENPGDPSGPPEEVCNCRCTMSYQEPGGGLQEAGGAEEGIVAPDEMPDEYLPDTGEALTDGPATEVLDKSYASWGAALTTDDTDALWAYRTNGGFKQINSELRAGKVTGDLVKLEPSKGLEGNAGWTPTKKVMSVSTAVKLIDKVIEAAPETSVPLDMSMFRGVGKLTDVFGAKGPRVGQVVDEKAYISTTTEASSALDYAGGFETINAAETGGVIEVRVPSGTKGAWIRGVSKAMDGYEEDLGEFGSGNHELILARDQQYRVVSVEERNVMEFAPKDTNSEAYMAFEDFHDPNVMVKVVKVELIPKGTVGAKTSAVAKKTVVEERARHVVAETDTAKVEPVKGRSSDTYIASLQDELATTNNVISYMNRKVKAGTATKADTGRLEALRKRKEDIRQLISSPDPKGELSRIRNQMNYMKRKVRDGSATEETAARLKILQARADVLTRLTKGDGLKIQKEAKKTAAKVVVPEKTAIQKLIEGAQKTVDAEKTKELNYSSGFDLQTLLADEPVGKAVLIPAHDIQTGGGYTYHSGASLVWKDKSGVVFKREVGLEPWQQAEQDQISKKAEALVESLPESVRWNLEMVTMAKDLNPADPYWAKEFKHPGFRSAATGGNGQMFFWGTDRYGTFQQGVFDHEMGHIAGDWGGPLDVSQWQQAKLRDKTSSAKLREKLFYGGPGSGGSHAITIGETAVSKYGSNNTNEDWAESMRLWLQSRRTGSIGTITDARGFLKPVSFADVFPARAKIMAREFGSGEYPPTG